MMKTTQMIVTPALAAEWLAVPRQNRKVSMEDVRLYAAQMRAGTFETTHQGILLGKDNTVLDGQHRLLAVVHSETPVRLQVSTDPSRSSAVGVPVDLQRKRTIDFVLGLSKPVAVTTNFLFRFVNSHRAGIAELEHWAAVLGPHVLALPDTHNRKALGSAAFMSALVARRLKSPEAHDYINACVLKMRANEAGPLQMASPRVYSLFLQIPKLGKLSTNIEAMVRVYRAFDPKERARVKVQIKDAEASIAEIRALLHREVSA